MNVLRKCLIGNSVVSRLIQEKRTVISVRFLYNEQFLGIDKYAEARQRTLSRLGSMKDGFYNRMQSQLNSSVPSMIFTEDLKTVIHSCEDNPEEIEMCIKMIKRFHKQNKELRFGTFIFGPVAMRLFYYLKKKDEMVNFLNNPEFEGFFDQLKSYYLCMDLCFKNEMYKEVLEAFQQLQSKQLAETRYPREAIVLAAGSCFKLNTPENFQFTTELVTQAREARVPVLRKALLFVVALALNQNKPDVALEILSSVDRMNNITSNNLKVICLAELGRLQDAFDILRRVTDQDAPIQSRIRGEMCQSTLDVVQKAVEKSGDSETSHIYEQMCRSLKENNSITNQTIDDLVSMPIEPRAFPRSGDDLFSFRQKGRFPETSFRDRERPFGSERFGRDDFQPRRRRFAGLGEEFQ